MTDDLKKLIEKVIRKELESVAIEAVEIRPDVDSDGDDVLRVVVVLSTDKDFDVHHAKGLVRHIRSEMMKRSENFAFPLVSFVSNSDNKRLKAAAG